MWIKSSLVKKTVRDKAAGKIFQFQESAKFGNPHTEKDVYCRVKFDFPAILQLELPAKRVVVIGKVGAVEAKVCSQLHIEYPKPHACIIKAVFGINIR